MSSEALDRFGELLVRKVRNEAIDDWRMIVDGTMCSQRAQRLRDLLSIFDSEQKERFMELAPEIVDSVLHHLLWMLEQTEDVDVGVRLADGRLRSVRDESDGLSGELYGDHGWIARFSDSQL